jgi:hypothetical protein
MDYKSDLALAKLIPRSLRSNVDFILRSPAKSAGKAATRAVIQQTTIGQSHVGQSPLGSEQDVNSEDGKENVM